MPTRFHPEYDWLVEPKFYLGTATCYLIAIYAASDFMAAYKFDFDGWKMKQVMRLYNLVQIILCSYMVWLFMPEFLGLSSFDAFYGLNIPFTKRCEYGLLVHFCSKLLDFSDTIFMITRRRNRQVSFLHVFHHATIGIVWGIVINSGYGGSTSGWGAMANSFIHVVMYTHYLVTSFGIRNPFKKYITLLQLSQFALCLIHSFVVIFSSNYPSDIALIQSGYQVLMLYLFGRFYIQSYSKPKRKVSPKKEA